jgi:hypothetical protein
VTGDDRRESGFPLDCLTHAEIEDMAKASVAELAAQRFVSDDVDSVEVDERRAKCVRRATTGRRDQRLQDGLGRDHGDGARLGAATGACGHSAFPV